MEMLFILENSWFNYIGNQRKSSKNETPYVAIHNHKNYWKKISFENFIFLQMTFRKIPRLNSIDIVLHKIICYRYLFVTSNWPFLWMTTSDVIKCNLLHRNVIKIMNSFGCSFKNGSLMRQHIMESCAGSWEKFSQMLKATPPGNNGKIGIL